MQISGDQFQMRLFTLLEPAESGDRVDKAIDISILSLISLNILSVILESYDSLDTRFHQVFRVFEIVSVAVFTVEYLCRLYVSYLKYPAENRLKALFKYMMSPMALIDLMG